MWIEVIPDYHCVEIYLCNKNGQRMKLTDDSNEDDYFIRFQGKTAEIKDLTWKLIDTEETML